MKFSKQKDLKLDDQLIYLGFYNLQVIDISYVSDFFKGICRAEAFLWFQGYRRGIQNNSCMCFVENDMH